MEFLLFQVLLVLRVLGGVGRETVEERLEGLLKVAAVPAPFTSLPDQPPLPASIPTFQMLSVPERVPSIV